MRNNPLGLVDPLGLDYCQGTNGVIGDEEGGDNNINCAAAGGQWVITPTQVDVTDTVPDDVGTTTIDWALTFTTSFFTFAGGPGNKPTCAGQALKQIVKDLNPFAHQGAEMVGQAARQAQMARALQYAAGRPNVAGGIGLICPQCSSVFRGMMSKAKLLGEIGDGFLAIEVSVAANSARKDVSEQARNGDCAAALPIL